MTRIWSCRIFIHNITNFHDSQRHTLKIQLKPMENLMKIQNLAKRVLPQPPFLFRTLKTEASIHEICLSYLQSSKSLNLGHAFTLVLILTNIWSYTPTGLAYKHPKYWCQKFRSIRLSFYIQTITSTKKLKEKAKKKPLFHSFFLGPNMVASTFWLFFVLFHFLGTKPLKYDTRAWVFSHIFRFNSGKDMHYSLHCNEGIY